MAIYPNPKATIYYYNIIKIQGLIIGIVNYWHEVRVIPPNDPSFECS